MLRQAYGPVPWWSDDPYTVLFQSVLVQNTTWRTVQKVTAAMGDRLDPRYVQQLPQQELEDLIRPCGLCKSRAATIRRLTDWYAASGFDSGEVCRRETGQLRRELLALRGIGEETADVILLYAFRKPAFAVDAYTRRFLRRFGYEFADDAAIRRFFEQGLGQDVQMYGQFHWLVLEHGGRFCRKKPACSGCPLRDSCARRTEESPGTQAQPARLNDGPAAEQSCPVPGEKLPPAVPQKRG